MRFLGAAPRALTPLALAAAGLALAVPSAAIARRSNLLLAALVLVSALGITAGELRDDPHRHRTSILILSVVPLVVLSAAAWAIGRPFDAPVRDGLLAASTPLGRLRRGHAAGGIRCCRAHGPRAPGSNFTRMSDDRHFGLAGLATMGAHLARNVAPRHPGGSEVET